MRRFNAENTPGVGDDVLREMNERFEAAIAGRDPALLGDVFLAALADAIREDITVQRKVDNAFTTYQAKGNRESLA